MNSLLKRKPKSNTKKKVFFAVVLGGFLLLVQFLFPTILRTTLGVVARPLWMLRDASTTGLSGFFAYFTRQSTLQKENELLRNELWASNAKEIQYELLKTEYADLKALVQASSTTGTLLARVISRPPFTLYDSFVVDRGSNDGVVVGDKVFAHEAFVIGLVTSVASDFSYVTLFSSGGENREMVIGRTGNSVSVSGRGGGNFEIVLPKDFDILVGDVLLEPSYDLGMVAQVYAVDEASQSSFKKVYARTPYSFFQIKSVLIE